MSGDLWIVIPNWDRFQHYKDRDPVWVKNWTALLHNDAYLGLSGHCRAVLHGLWLAYASSHCQLRVDTLSLTRQLGLRVSSRQLESLNHAGFIEFSASRPLAPRYHSRAREKEVSKETSKTRVRASDSQAARSHAPEKNDAPEPPVDPDALAKLKGIQQLIGRPL